MWMARWAYAWWQEHGGDPSNCSMRSDLKGWAGVKGLWMLSLSMFWMGEGKVISQKIYIYIKNNHLVCYPHDFSSHILVSVLYLIAFYCRACTGLVQQPFEEWRFHWGTLPSDSAIILSFFFFFYVPQLISLLQIMVGIGAVGSPVLKISSLYSEAQILIWGLLYDTE